jgi:hypothetical protein
MARCTYKGIKFHSRVERDVYKVLLKYFKEGQITRQKRYFKDRKFTCDFYFGELNPPTWIEVSTYLKPRNLAKLNKKRKWIESRNEIFMHVSDPLILEGHLNRHFFN